MSTTALPVSGLDYSIVFRSVFRAITINANISHTASTNAEQPCPSLRRTIKYIPTWCDIGTHAILFPEREGTTLRITTARKRPKGVNIMSVLAYRDPVRMALRLEIKALQKQVRQLKDLLDEANTYIPADRYILTRDKLGSWFYKRVTSREKTS